MKKLFPLVFVLLALLVWGCGGSGIQPSNNDSRGDGSIPIGRTIGGTRGTTSVKMTFSDGSVRTAVPEPGGMLRVDSAPEGPMTIQVHSEDPEFLDSTYSTVLGECKNQVFNVKIQSANRAGDVDSVEFKNQSPLRLKVGDKVKLSTKLYGSKTGGLDPTLIMSGGEGMIDATDHFIAVSVGSGTITAELFGKTATLDVIIEP